MEKQKVFWVVLSVSVFVVVVLVAGVLLLRQQPGTAPHATVSPMTGPGNGTGTQLYEYQREAQPPAGPQAGTPPASDQQTMHFYIGEGAKPGTPTTPGGTSAAPVPVPAPAPAAPAPVPAPAPITPAPPVATRSPARPSAAAPSVRPAPVAAAASSRPAPVASSRAAPPQASRPRAVRPTLQSRAQKKGPGYWIQTGSYKSQTKAEELMSLLQTKGLGSRVFSWTSKGETFFRVRVGPYSNKEEADKFLSLVQQVQGLETSYVSMVPAPRTSIN
jgi:cell division septation protein DedD